MKKSVTKWIAALCAALLTLGAFGCTGGSDSVISSAFSGADSTSGAQQPTATAEPTYGTFQSNLLPSTAHADVTFSEMTYQRPDIEGMQAQMDTLTSDVESGKPVQMLITAYRALQKQ